MHIQESVLFEVYRRLPTGRDTYNTDAALRAAVEINENSRPARNTDIERLEAALLKRTCE